MKSLFSLFVIVAIALAGCSKKGPAPVKFDGVAVTVLAGGAKTKSGKKLDVYEVKGTSAYAIFMLVGGGKLSNSGKGLLLNDNEFQVEAKQLRGGVLVVDVQQPVPVPMPGAMIAQVVSKCKQGGIIDLPIDEALASPHP